MAKCSRRGNYLLATFVLFLYFLVGLEVSYGNDFGLSVKTVNGRISVNWKLSALWDNATVYFITNFKDMASNKSYSFYFTTCQAYKLNKKLDIEPTTGLLEFCNNKFRRCGPVVNSTLTSALMNKKTGEMSCQLFTMCTNYEDMFQIRVYFNHGGNSVVGFETPLITIFSENNPPDFKGSDTKVTVVKWDRPNMPVVLKINYFEPSELCGFDKPEENIYFRIKYHKLNDTNCFDLGVKNVFYEGSSTEVKFDEILKETEILLIEVEAISRGAKRFSNRKMYRIETLKKDQKCNIIGGVLNISWRPLWKCFPDKNYVEVAYFCFLDGDNDAEACFPVCESSFFANGTLRHTRTYNDVIPACKERSHHCSIHLYKDLAMHTVSWSPETQRMSCVLYRTCMDYSRFFSVKIGLTLENERRDVMYFASYVCFKQSFIYNNQPATPQDVTAIDIQTTQFTITWKSIKCEIDNYNIELHINISGSISRVKEIPVGTDGLNYIYQHTVRSVQPYQEFMYQVYASYNGLKPQSSNPSPLKRLRTKPSAPDAAPTLIGIRSEPRGIRLTWTFPNVESLNGLPNETRIIGKDENGTEVYRGSVFGVKRTSALLAVNETQRCAFYQVKFCNAPHLCSEYSSSNSFQLQTCEKGPTLAQLTEAVTESSSILWIMLAIAITVVVVVVIVTVTCYRKERQDRREKLPTLTAGNDQTGDYIPIGQLSHPGEYNTLDEKERFDELETTL